MATKTKHVARSHRSYHNPKPFANFEKKALTVKETREARKSGLLSSLKSLFHRTTNK